MLLMINIDDVSMELLPLHMDNLLEMGAKNVHYVFSHTKKGRMGVIAFVDVEEKFIDSVLDYLAVEVGTIGARVLEAKHIQFEYAVERVYVFCRESEYSCDVKVISKGKRKHAKVEYEDLKNLSRELNIPVDALKSMIETFVLSGEETLKCTSYGNELSFHR